MMKDHVWITSRNKRLSAMLHLPASFREKTPLIVCCHGFTGDKVGYNHLTRNLATFLEETGYGVLRFDYAGSGDSEGDFVTETSVANWKADLLNVLAWVKAQPLLVSSPVILYGHSLGGLVVLTHKNEQYPVDARMVFAPVTQPLYNFREIILGAELWQRSENGQRIGNFFGRGFQLEPQFVRDLLESQYDPIADAAQLDTRLLLVHGTEDVAVPIQGSRELNKKYRGPKEFVELPIDHGAVGAQEQLYTVIGSWLKKYYPLD